MYHFSWEPSENVAGCERLLKSFWRHVGDDNEDYPVGYETFATEDWIGRINSHRPRTLPYGINRERKEIIRQQLWG